MIKRFAVNKNNITNRTNIKKTLSNRKQFFYFKNRIFIPRSAKNGQLDIGKKYVHGKTSNIFYKLLKSCNDRSMSVD